MQVKKKYHDAETVSQFLQNNMGLGYTVQMHYAMKHILKQINNTALQMDELGFSPNNN